MRLALKRLLASSTALSILQNAVQLGGASFCQQYSLSAPTQGQTRRCAAAKEEGREEHAGSAALISLYKSRKRLTALRMRKYVAGEDYWRVRPKARARLSDAQKWRDVERVGRSLARNPPEIRMVSVTKDDLHSGNLSSETQSSSPPRVKRTSESWTRRLETFEQHQYESDIESPAFQGPRLVDDPQHSRNWSLWLELIVFRKRHHGFEGTTAICKTLLRQLSSQRALRLPTRGIIANQLWDLLIRSGFYDSSLLEEIITYAISLKHATGRSWPDMYYSIVSVALKKDPDSAYSWHLKIRNDFPPLLDEYKKLFKQSLDWGTSEHLRCLYKDTPLLGMYRTVIWHLCKLQMHSEALEWHDLLCGLRDFPVRLADVKPLLEHLVYIGDGPRLEKIVGALAEAKVEVKKRAEESVRRHPAISREIMNRRLGEVHGIAPKHLSDSFCARLFATRLFSVNTIISGLQMMAAEEIGPLSLREIAVRDNCDPGMICDHTDALRNAGISLDSSVFCTLIRSLAVENKSGILKSVVGCDLHPDAFADPGLQERLLAQYYEKNDLMKIERTLAVLTMDCWVNDLRMVRMNLILRCLTTLGRRGKVLAMLEQMKHEGISVSTRSSRHLRVCWLSRRQRGRGAEEVFELSLLIQASQMSMQSGHFVPLVAWREILRRLGMAGRLTEFENLALWLVDWYSSPAATAALPKRILLSSHRGQALIGGHGGLERPANRDPQRFLNLLFTTAARHAIVAWGFQHISSKKASGEDGPRFRWQWGLHLLYKLRERGVPIQKGQVARICRHRLNTLFGPGSSKRKINRRARLEQSAFESYTESVYVRKMEAIWGEDLFRVWPHSSKKLLRKRTGRKPQRV